MKNDKRLTGEKKTGSDRVVRSDHRDGEVLSIIEIRSNRRKRRVMKVVACVVAFVFFVQQIGFADVFRRRQTGSLAGRLLSSSSEQDQQNKFAPAYLKRQQQKHEEIIRQKMDQEELIGKVRFKTKQQKPEEAVPLKKKRSSASGGGIYFTLEDYDRAGAPRQLNAYTYQDGNARGRLKEMVSYDISKMDSGTWTGQAKEIENDDGDKFMGSNTPLQGADSLTEQRIIRKTVYGGEKGDEKVDYVLSGYNDEGIATEVTVYDYGKKGGADLDETRTYNVSGLDIDFEGSGWKEELGEDLLIRTTVYEGPEDEEKIVYVVDGYLFDDNGENEPNRIAIYDYDKEGGDNLDEVRTYYITDMAEGDWLQEEDSRLSSIVVYEGEKDKEKARQTFSYFFEEEGDYVPWERKDHFYRDEVLIETKIYDISALGADEMLDAASGELEEHAFFIGDKNFEKITRNYNLYDEDGSPQLRTDYIYDGRALSDVKTYDIAGMSVETYDVVDVYPDIQGLLQEETLYEGKAGVERILKVVSYYQNSAVMKETVNTYGENTRGKKYIAHSTTKNYSMAGDLTERTETDNDLLFSRYGVEKEDENGNIRRQNTRTYFTFQGIEKLDREEDVVFSGYTVKGQAGLEKRTKYIYSDANEKMPVEYQEMVNHMFNSKGNVINQTVDSYMIDSSGEEIYDHTKEIENHKFDYYGNVLSRSETIWLSRTRRDISQLMYHKTIRNDYDDLLARRRGNSTFTETARYNSLDKTDEHKIDRTVATTGEFDTRGYVVKQTSDTYVTDTGVAEKLTLRKDIHNFDIDSRGNAGTQHITTYRTDQDGNFVEDTDGDYLHVSYQVFTNRAFDSRHNATNQMICTYDEKDGVLLDVQEIRSVGFHPSGIALNQVIASYAEIDERGNVDPSSLASVKVINNNTISAFGNIGKSVITYFRDCAILDNGSGKIIYDEKDAMERQTIVTAKDDFDLRGNARRQEIITEDYNEKRGTFDFIERQDIVNDTFDFHDRTHYSVITVYSDKGAVEQKHIRSSNFTLRGKAKEQTIITYLYEDNVRDADPADFQVVINSYDAKYENLKTRHNFRYVDDWTVMWDEAYKADGSVDTDYFNRSSVELIDYKVTTNSYDPGE
ncbi:MAG: hypothetical protein KJ995_02810, partial [Candidatus Omnitrophica bacterium]|nr:hypothetical protein [Candidatus Omnitrophota bacterium]